MRGMCRSELEPAEPAQNGRLDDEGCRGRLARMMDPGASRLRPATPGPEGLGGRFGLARLRILDRRLAFSERGRKRVRGRCASAVPRGRDIACVRTPQGRMPRSSPSVGIRGTQAEGGDRQRGGDEVQTRRHQPIRIRPSCWSLMPRVCHAAHRKPPPMIMVRPASVRRQINPFPPAKSDKARARVPALEFRRADSPGRASCAGSSVAPASRSSCGVRSR